LKQIKGVQKDTNRAFIANFMPNSPTLLFTTALNAALGNF
jgi:hypothetical protein